MDRRIRRLASGLAVVSCAAGAAAPLSSATADVAAPRALHGTLPGGSDRTTVRVFATPDDAATASTKAGGRRALFELPASAVRVTGSGYSVSIRPEQLPADVKSPARLVTFEVVAQDRDNGRYGVATASVRYVPTPAGGRVIADRWAEPAAVDVPLGGASSGTSVPGAARAATAATIVWGARRNVWATIGSGYPASGQTSWMRFVSTRSQEFTASLGVAMAYNKVGFNYSERGTKSLDRAFGFDWDRSRAQRLYQVGVTYRHALVDLGPNPSNLRYISEWIPYRYNGGTHDVRGRKRPDWRHCVSQARGDWFRNLTTGRAYENSAGVHLVFADVSLSSRRGYNREAQLGYHNARGQRLCGSNADPAHAGAIMQRKK